MEKTSRQQQGLEEQTKLKLLVFLKEILHLKNKNKKNPQSKIKKENNFSIKVAKREAKSKQPSTRNYF